jgi:hypothetical protein
MRHRLLRGTVFAAVLFASISAHAAVTRVAGPATLYAESRGLVKFDAAYDSQNHVYLVVWGTQLAGPVNGMLVSEAGAPLTGLFALSAGLQQSGWARVIYSAEEGKFLVSFVRIMGPQHHQKVARFVTVSGSTPSVGPEMILDDWTGDAGTATGIAYSAPSGKFLVTWSHYAFTSSGQFVPNSFVAAITGAGVISPTQTISDPNDGESDPEIACDPATRRCLVIGVAWGMGSGGKSSFWARYIDDSTGAPIAAAGYPFVWGGLMDPPAVVYSAVSSRFLMGVGAGGTIRGIFGDGAAATYTAPFMMMQDLSGTQGVGYGFLSLRYHPRTQMTLASMTTWVGLGAVQVLDGNGARVANGFDLIPDTPDIPSKPWDTANQFTVVAPTTTSSGFMVFEDHYFKAIRGTVYSGGPSGPAITSLSSSSAGTVLVGSAVTWTAAASGGTDPLVYEFERWRPTTGWQTVRPYASSSSATIPAVAGAQIIRVNVKQTSASATEASRESGTFAPPPTPALSLTGTGGADLFAYNPSNGGGHIVAGTFGALTETNYGTGWGPGNVVTTADFNGDGLTDLFVYNPTSGVGQRAINLGSNTFDYDYYFWSPGLTVVAGDFNGDRRDDLFTYSKTTGVWTKLLTDSATVFQVSTGLWSLDWELYTGDFNGDGVTDLFVYNKNLSSPNAGRWLRVINGFNGAFSAYIEGSIKVWTPTWTLIPGDFDGDGKTDIFLYGPDGRWYKVFFPTLSGPERYVDGLWSLNWTPSAGDFDGNGKTDMFVYNKLTGRFVVALSTGDGWVYYEGPLLWSTGWVATVTDINRDRRADLILYNPLNGRWFQVISSTVPGQFGYYTGPDFETGLTIVATGGYK